MVLVVDDHPDTCIALTKLLRRSGVTAEFVTSGEDALGFMNRQVPKLVILDVMMPDMNGIDVLRAIRRNLEFEKVAVMMYSADAASNRMKEAMRDGAQAYLIKGSIGWDQLVNEVKRFV
jgi:CheY-like chemotaxis protein